MSMLSQRALPSRHPEQWMADPGCGYTVQTDVQLWMRDRLVEAIDIVPFGYADTAGSGRSRGERGIRIRKNALPPCDFCRRAAFLYSFGTKSAKKTQNLRQNAFKPLTGGKETDTL